MADPSFRAEFDRLLREYAGLPSLLYDAERFSEAVGARVLLKREDLNHTGAHKIRNVLGPGPAHDPDGQAAGHRRDRRRPARRGDGHRLRVLRPRLRRLHGRGRHRPAGAQRGPDADARRRGRPGHDRQPHPQGRHQRGAARLGRQRRLDALPARHGRRARIPSRRWSATSPAASATRRGRSASSSPAPCPTRRSPASAAAPTRSGCSPRSSGTRACGSTASRPAVTASRPAGTRPRSRPARSASCTAPGPTCCRTTTARPSSPTRSRRASTTRASDPSTPTCTRPAGRRTARSPTPRRWTRWRC